MSERAVTVVLSDLHMGGGKADPSDDFIHSRNQFSALLADLSREPEGRDGEIELVINGDFLELVQVRPEVYRLGSADYWCSQRESLRKLDAVLQGHPEVFESLKDFQSSGNQVTLAAGNHDVDFYWPQVQGEIRRAAGENIVFELGEYWWDRYDGRLRISHGHQIDPANRFEHWGDPRLLAGQGEMRLEMCPGTLFVIKFVNWLEKRYPFADNLHPVTRLAGLLAKQDRAGLFMVFWMLARFTARHPGAALGVDREELSIEPVLQSLEYDDRFAQELATLWNGVRGEAVTLARLRQELHDEQALADFMWEVLARIPADEWIPVFDRVDPAVLSASGGGAAILSVGKAGMMSKQLWREEARQQWRAGAQVVVMGHTHQPDTVRENGSAYFNSGSWTRYVEESELEELTLEDLKSEEAFPYQLNYVRIAPGGNGRLESRMICFEQG